MSRIPPDGDEKPLVWMGSSKRDLMDLLADVREEIGAALGAAQFGEKSDSAKPWHGDGSGVFEVVENDDGRAFRAVYTVRFEKAVYVLHVFEKKSKKGRETPKQDKDLVESRLKDAREHYKSNFEED